MSRQQHLPESLLRASGVDDRTVEAYREAVRRYGTRRWVTGISISRKETGGKLARSPRPVIAIHVRRKTKLPASSRTRIPEEILGVATDIVHGDYRLASNGAGGTPSTLAPGASISCKRGTAGTLGAIVQLPQGGRCVLTAGHVLRECGKCKKGAPILSPGVSDGGSLEHRTIASIEDNHFGLDAGIARLSDGITAHNVALSSGIRITSPVLPAIDVVLEKSGRSTGVTKARVQGIGTFLGVFPAIQLRPLLGGMATVISEAGDSGAVWYVADTGDAVGLHVAGGVSAGNTYAIAAVMTEVLTGLNVSWT